MRVKVLLIVCLVIVFFSFCKKESETRTTIHILEKPTKNIPLSNAVKDWGLFQVGTYWIMQDSVTQTKDSIYVVSVESSNSSPLYYSVDSNAIYQQIKISFNSNPVMSSFTLRSDAIILSKGSEDILVFIEDTTKKLYPIYNGAPINKSLSTYTISANVFTNIRFSYLTVYHDVPHYHTFYYSYTGTYWKKNLGMIKFQYIAPDYRNVRELLRYHIVQ